MIGVSLYFTDYKLDYLKEAIRLGVKAVFTTIVMPEESYDGSEFKQRLHDFLELANEHNIEVITDISERIYDKLGIKSIFELKNLGFSSVRVDSGFGSADEIKELADQFQVYLNGSHLKEETLASYQSIGTDMSHISVMHNFYPRVNTGLREDMFNRVNRMFKRYGCRIVAFIPGDKNFRNPVFMGLPTLEKHRGINPYAAYLELKYLNVDDVFIGDTEADYNTLSLILKSNESKVTELSAYLLPKYRYLYDQVLDVRDDLSPDVLRIRKIDNRQIEPNHLLNRLAGSITIDNKLGNRYEGEINLIKHELPMENSVNVIGHIDPELIYVLDILPRNSQVRLRPFI
ncbi:MupG family TIM beta-alpha barrel fold protein [Lapidilactobacillus bayanensis]|uniref:MupG family TIM beta-alpha barrel fold protein n=1 Tax=Lapidilactobacillus bayanensis TaxID=2485998 RepID=UPI000F7932E3|nr:MupG family TIM beta-alpha barrel fold protein [Lapidilactobacillus bayanensis]